MNILLIRLGSPKAIIKLGVDARLITTDEYIIFIKMINDRNLTSHAYNVIIAEEISYAIPAYYQLMKKVAHHIINQK